MLQIKDLNTFGLITMIIPDFFFALSIYFKVKECDKKFAAN